MKLLILATLLSIVQASPPVPPKKFHNPAPKSQQQAKNAEGDKTPATPTPVRNDACPESRHEDGSIKQSNEQEHPVTISKLPPVSVTRDKWDWFSLALTALLVAIGGITVGAIWYQARETRKAADAAKESADATRKSAEAMEKSVRLQEAQLEQWIDTTDDWDVWNSNLFPSSTYADVTVSCAIINPTKMLLTLRGVNVKMGNAERNIESLRHVLSPDGTPYSVTPLNVRIAGDEFVRFKGHTFEVSVVVAVQFEDAFGAMCSQAIEYSCRLGQGRQFELTERRNTKTKNQNPN